MQGYQLLNTHDNNTACKAKHSNTFYIPTTEKSCCFQHILHTTSDEKALLHQILFIANKTETQVELDSAPDHEQKEGA